MHPAIDASLTLASTGPSPVWFWVVIASFCMSFWGMIIVYIIQPKRVIAMMFITEIIGFILALVVILFGPSGTTDSVAWFCAILPIGYATWIAIRAS